MTRQQRLQVVHELEAIMSSAVPDPRGSTGPNGVTINVNAGGNQIAIASECGEVTIVLGRRADRASETEDDPVLSGVRRSRPD